MFECYEFFTWLYYYFLSIIFNVLAAGYLDQTHS